MSAPIAEIAACLDQGGVVLIPTDTVLGLAAAPRHPSAVERIYALKNRPTEKNLPIMVADADQIAALGAEIGPVAKRLLSSDYCPGPLTLVLPLNGDRPAWLEARDEIAVRIPDDARLRAVLRETGPLLVTSANRSGADTPHDTAAAAAQLTGQPDLTIRGTCQTRAASTIVNCTVSPPAILRDGAVNAAALMPYLEGTT